jgi:hypothetical protein
VPHRVGEAVAKQQRRLVGPLFSVFASLASRVFSSPSIFARSSAFAKFGG